jgi:anthranilate synthase component 1
MLSESEFQNHARAGHRRIPLVRAVPADLETPLSVYLKLAQGAHSYLFESVLGGEQWGRYSIIGLPCRTVVQVRGEQVTVTRDGKVTETTQTRDPLAFVRAFHARYPGPDLPGLPRFTGGLVGYFGYDIVRSIEPVLGACRAPDEIGAPDALLMVSDEVAVFDNLAGRLYLVIQVNPEIPDAYRKATARLDELVQRLNGPLPEIGDRPRFPPPNDGSQQETVVPATARGEMRESEFVSGFTQAGFEAAVEKSKEYIRAGDIMQVVLSQRLTAPFPFSPLDLYRALRVLNPSPYMYFLDLGDHHVVGSSPEILVRLEDGTVTVRPIAGTRPRGHDADEDMRLEKELLADPKELAEHLMLIDLGRNDVGRIAQTGSVRLTDKMIVERYSHVMHIVSNVTARLQDGKDAIDVLRATFPAGTVSGAPKVRAMQIIDELEPVKRGIYSGAVGYIGWNGNMDTAIAIRTAVIKDGKLHVQAGAGIVADSLPRNEWIETMNKARALLRAAARAAVGLRAED